MQALVEKHGAKLVAGGSLNRKEYGQLSIEQLRKVAKRYQADAQLQKYARARVALLELEGPGEDPVPCAPLRPVAQASREENSSLTAAAFFRNSRVFLWQLLTHPVWKYVCLIALLLCLAKPFVMNAMSKYMVRVMRVIIRQGFLLVSLVLESIADELIYQLEFALRDALPPPSQNHDIPREPFQKLSHLMSAVIGAGCFYMTSLVRARHIGLQG